VHSKHSSPGGQPGQAPPPQSIDVSSPLRSPSTHVGAAHDPPKHTFDLQSPLTLQSKPGAHGRQSEPPQSTSVSGPSSRPFVHRSMTVVVVVVVVVI